MRAERRTHVVRSERALYDHLVDYDSVASDTPFISTTAGTVEVDAARARNVFFPPMYTALRFATRNFTQDSYVARAYARTCTRSAGNQSSLRNSRKRYATSIRTQRSMRGIRRARSSGRSSSPRAA